MLQTPMNQKNPFLVEGYLSPDYFWTAWKRPPC